MDLDIMFPSARPLEEFSGRMVTNHEEMVGEVQSLVNEVCKNQKLVAPLIELMKREEAGEDIDSSDMAEADTLIDSWIGEYFKSKGYRAPHYCGPVVAGITTWWLRHNAWGADLGRVDEILATHVKLLPGEPTIVSPVKA